MLGPLSPAKRTYGRSFQKGTSGDGKGPAGLAIFRFLAGIMLGEPIPLCGHSQQRLSLMPVVRFGGVTTTFWSTLSIMIGGRHARRVIRTD